MAGERTVASSVPRLFRLAQLYTELQGDVRRELPELLALLRDDLQVPVLPLSADVLAGVPQLKGFVQSSAAQVSALAVQEFMRTHPRVDAATAEYVHAHCCQLLQVQVEPKENTPELGRLLKSMHGVYEDHVQYALFVVEQLYAEADAPDGDPVVVDFVRRRMNAQDLFAALVSSCADAALVQQQWSDDLFVKCAQAVLALVRYCAPVSDASGTASMLCALLAKTSPNALTKAPYVLLVCAWLYALGWRGTSLFGGSDARASTAAASDGASWAAQAVLPDAARLRDAGVMPHELERVRQLAILAADFVGGGLGMSASGTVAGLGIMPGGMHAANAALARVRETLRHTDLGACADLFADMCALDVMAPDASWGVLCRCVLASLAHGVVGAVYQSGERVSWRPLLCLVSDVVRHTPEAAVLFWQRTGADGADTLLLGELLKRGMLTAYDMPDYFELFASLVSDDVTAVQSCALLCHEPHTGGAAGGGSSSGGYAYGGGASVVGSAPLAGLPRGQSYPQLAIRTSLLPFLRDIVNRFGAAERPDEVDQYSCCAILHWIGNTCRFVAERAEAEASAAPELVALHSSGAAGTNGVSFFGGAAAGMGMGVGAAVAPPAIQRGLSMSSGAAGGFLSPFNGSASGRRNGRGAQFASSPALGGGALSPGMLPRGGPSALHVPASGTWTAPSLGALDATSASFTHLLHDSALALFRDDFRLPYLILCSRVPILIKCRAYRLLANCMTSRTAPEVLGRFMGAVDIHSLLGELEQDSQDDAGFVGTCAVLKFVRCAVAYAAAESAYETNLSRLLNDVFAPLTFDRALNLDGKPSLLALEVLCALSERYEALGEIASGGAAAAGDAAAVQPDQASRLQGVCGATLRQCVSDRVLYRLRSMLEQDDRELELEAEESDGVSVAQSVQSVRERAELVAQLLAFLVAQQRVLSGGRRQLGYEFSGRPVLACTRLAVRFSDTQLLGVLAASGCSLQPLAGDDKAGLRDACVQLVGLFGAPASEPSPEQCTAQDASFHAAFVDFLCVCMSRESQALAQQLLFECRPGSSSLIEQLVALLGSDRLLSSAPYLMEGLARLVDLLVYASAEPARQPVLSRALDVGFLTQRLEAVHGLLSVVDRSMTAISVVWLQISAYMCNMLSIALNLQQQGSRGSWSQLLSATLASVLHALRTCARDDLRSAVYRHADRAMLGWKQLFVVLLTRGLVSDEQLLRESSDRILYQLLENIRALVREHHAVVRTMAQCCLLVSAHVRPNDGGACIEVMEHVIEHVLLHPDVSQDVRTLVYSMCVHLMRGRGASANSSVAAATERLEVLLQQQSPRLMQALSIDLRSADHTAAIAAVSFLALLFAFDKRVVEPADLKGFDVVRPWLAPLHTASDSARQHVMAKAVLAALVGAAAQPVISEMLVERGVLRTLRASPWLTDAADRQLSSDLMRRDVITSVHLVGPALRVVAAVLATCQRNRFLTLEALELASAHIKLLDRVVGAGLRCAAPELAALFAVLRRLIECTVEFHLVDQARDLVDRVHRWTQVTLLQLVEVDGGLQQNATLLGEAVGTAAALIGVPGVDEASLRDLAVAGLRVGKVVLASCGAGVTLAGAELLQEIMYGCMRLGLSAMRVARTEVPEVRELLAAYDTSPLSAQPAATADTADALRFVQTLVMYMRVADASASA